LKTIDREKGVFFTPLNFAKLGLEYLENSIVNNWWQSGEYRLWDMAAGTGNLEINLPEEAHKYCYLSTIYNEDIDICKTQFPTSKCFQYDYLNDDIDLVFNNFAKVLNFGEVENLKENWKLPENLRNDLQNPKIKWIVLINPPYATSQTAGKNSESKQGVSDTKIRKIMHNNNLGEVSRELFSQFIFRIKKEFENKNTILAMFSKIKYLNATNDQKLRDQVFNFKFEKGFIFSSSNFEDTSRLNQFPVGFLIWNLSFYKQIEKQDIIVDIFNENLQNIGTKLILVENKNKFLNNWINRPVANIKFPPVGSAITLKTDNKDVRDRISTNFLASFMCAGNCLQSQNQTALFSMPSASAGAFSVTPTNFEKAMIIHAVRRIPKANWLNDRDQFLQPTKEISQEFINDTTIWNIFSNSNQTVAMQNVVYENNIYQIKNHFFPFQTSDLETWNITYKNIINFNDNYQNRFLANWLINKDLSFESQNVLNLGKEIYKLYFENLHKLELSKYKIETWDAGWWQIRNALKNFNLANNLFKEFKILNNRLCEKLLNQIYDYKFITK